jgi:hypothetical protein
MMNRMIHKIEGRIGTFLHLDCKKSKRKSCLLIDYYWFSLFPTYFIDFTLLIYSIYLITLSYYL